MPPAAISAGRFTVKVPEGWARSESGGTVVFTDKLNRVKKVYSRLPAWYGVVWVEWGAHSVLELPPGSTEQFGLRQGDEISIV